MGERRIRGAVMGLVLLKGQYDLDPKELACCLYVYNASYVSDDLTTA